MLDRGAPVGVGLGAGITATRAWVDALRTVEGLGYGSAWVNEGIGGADPFVQAAMGLAATRQMTVGTGIANLWARHPYAMAGAAATLASMHPGRFALGMGVGFRPMVEAMGDTWRAPLGHAEGYLVRMAAAPASGEGARPPRLLAALGPRMLEVARVHADGAHPHSMPVAHTERARATLGPGKLLVVGLPVILEEDPVEARAVARQRMPALRMPSSPYGKALVDLGMDDGSLAEGGSDELVDELCAWGSGARVAARVSEHLAAGADHVVVSLLGLELEVAVERLVALRPALAAAGLLPAG